MTRIFVTGKKGFIGSHLVSTLLDKKYKITDDPDKGSIWILLAGRMGSDDLFENLKNNFLLNIRLIKKTKKFPERIVYISSIDVYLPETYYAVAKIASEYFLKVFCKEKDIKLVILRPSQIYGPGDGGKKAIPKFIEKIKKNEVIELYDRGRAKRKYLYVSDLVDAIVKAVETDVAGTFDIVGEKLIAVRKVVDVLEKVMNRKAKIELKFIPKVGFEEGIRLTIKGK